MLSKIQHLNTGGGNREELASRFADLHPPLNDRQALIESQRCLYCYDAPCTNACPTGIDVPAFIACIAQENPQGAARTILSQNILGGSCARVCQTEILCDQACVHNQAGQPNANVNQPIRIGLLQRHALDHAHFVTHPFQRAPATGRKVAIVGAGPAGLSCAHQLSLLGNEVTIFEAGPKPGGLNEYGVARYKLTDNYAQHEIAFLLQIGGIQIQYEQRLGRHFQLGQLTEQYDAVFLANGLGATRPLCLEEEQNPGLRAATDYIKDLRQSNDLTQLPVPETCIILGGGNTAIDMAVQIRLLGARQVMLVYRRGEQEMSATAPERQLALRHQVQFISWAQPVKILLDQNKKVRGMKFEKTAIFKNQLRGTGYKFDLAADMIFKATGQQLDLATYPTNALQWDGDKIWVDDDFQTSIPRVYAGGDCIMKDPDLTVYAVQHGKLAARAMHRAMNLRGAHHG